jgi:hypothetical protein
MSIAMKLKLCVPVTMAGAFAASSRDGTAETGRALMVPGWRPEAPGCVAGAPQARFNAPEHHDAGAHQEQ